MCGILFSLGLPGEDAVFDAALEAAAHRGPDGRGLRRFETAAGPVVLGHRRLAIIDTRDEALQPMSYEDERYWIVFNGEIYNHLELRAELEAHGREFRTRSDTEVLLAAFAEWGAACLDRLLGMFAFAIWDRGEQRVFAARDRFGIKPLYVHGTPRGFALASEIKQLAALPGFPREVNLARAWDFLATGLFDHTGETLFAGARQLRGGECFELSLARWRPGDSLPIRRWYRLPESGSLALSEAEAARRFRERLEDAVRIHLRADVRVGSCLSGGLDSSSIVCIAQRLLDAAGAAEPMHTITAGYDVARVDERRYAEAVAKHAGVVNLPVFPQEDELVRVLDRLTWHQDEPFGSTSIFAQWVVFEHARGQGIKVMLDGQGADEQLAGYETMFPQYLESLLQRRRFGELAWAMREVDRSGHWPLRAQIRTLFGARVPARMRGAFARLARLAPRGAKAPAPDPWLAGEAWERVDRRLPPFTAALERDGLAPASTLGRLCRAHLQTTNLPMLLHYEDRNSMAHGVEARVPFLDHRVVELSVGLGDEHKMLGAETKRVLREAMRGILPELVRARRDKLGFGTPEREWFRGALRGFVTDGVEEALRRFPGCFRAEGLRALAADMLDGRRELDFTLWRVVSLGAWARVFGLAL